MENVTVKVVGNEFKQSSDVILNSFSDINIAALTDFPIITLYKYPIDYPGKYVARISGVGSNNIPIYFNYIVVKDSLEDLQQCIPVAMVPIGRSPEDDSKIVESYI